MDRMLKEDWYTKVSLCSNINLYYKGHIRWLQWDYSEKAFFNDEFFWIESLNDIEYFVKNLNEYDADLNIIAIDNYTNEILIYVNDLWNMCLYINDNNELSSSIKNLLNNHSELDYQYLWLIRKFWYNQNDLTPYTNIKRLLPWFVYRWNRYLLYEKLTSIRLNTNKQHKEFMLPLYLTDSVTNRLRSIEDHTIWVLVSGWLDSSIITALLLQINKGLEYPKNFRFFTTENAEDLKYAEELAEFLWIKLEVIPWDDVELSPYELFEVNETPIDLWSVVPNIKLFKRISSMWIKTVFTWDWPDEMFRWYRRNAEDFDYHKHDMLNELVYYHFPRLEKAANYYGINLVTPYIQRNLWNMALTNEVKIYKWNLKDFATWLIPECIIQRTKEPLKNKQIREDKITYQHKFLNDFISYANEKCVSTPISKKSYQK